MDQQVKVRIEAWRRLLAESFQNVSVDYQKINRVISDMDMFLVDEEFD